jgi:oligopeptide/dipeptide ABC transporter ATP-binding protein
VEVRNLKKYFPIHKGLFGRKVGDVRAVDDVSFDVYPRETLGVVGESGCGKTTVGRTLLRLVEPTAGTASFDGKDIFGLGTDGLRSLRKQMQIIFQDPYSSLNPRQTVGSIIGDALELHGISKGDARFDRARELLERVGLQASYVNRYPHEFSGGQRQRIGIARAIALNPKFIVCDEAVSALDVSVQAQILNLLMDLQEEYELSYLFIAHDLSVVRHISRRVAVMYLGRIVEVATTGELFEHALHPYTQALLSAIPRPRVGGGGQRVVLEGDVPNPIAPPPGCHFHTRCPLVMDRCRSEVPQLQDARDGHRVRCHLYDGAAWPAEPIPIGAGRAPSRAAERAAAASAADADDEGVGSADVGAETGSADASGFGMFDGSESGDSARPIGIPEILRDKQGMALGPFGEIVDPDDSFVRTAEIPTLDAMTRSVDTTGPVMLSRDSTESEKPKKNEDFDPDGERTDIHERPVAEDGSLTGDLEPVTDAGAASASAEALPQPTTAAAARPRAPAPADDEQSAALGEDVMAEDTGIHPPVHDEEGVADDISLHAQDRVGTLEEPGGEGGGADPDGDGPATEEVPVVPDSEEKSRKS